MSDASDAGDASEQAGAGAGGGAGAAGATPTDVLLDAHRRLLRSLGETHNCILSIELRMKRTDESVSGLAQRLKVQGQVMQRLERRAEVLEGRWLAHEEGVARRAAQATKPDPGAGPPSSLKTGAAGERGRWRWRCAEAEARGRRLLRAAEDGRVVEVRAVLDAPGGADALHFSAGGAKWTALHRAARRAHLPVVKLLVQRGADVNAQTAHGYSPLHMAAHHDHDGRCVDVLLAAGSDVNLCNDFCRTPLHYAAENGNEVAVRALLAAGACKSVTDENNRTALQVARTNAIRQLLQPSRATANPPT